MATGWILKPWVAAVRTELLYMGRTLYLLSQPCAPCIIFLVSSHLPPSFPGLPLHGFIKHELHSRVEDEDERGQSAVPQSSHALTGYDLWESIWEGKPKKQFYSWAATTKKCLTIMIYRYTYHTPNMPLYCVCWRSSFLNFAPCSFNRVLTTHMGVVRITFTTPTWGTDG